MKKIIANIFLSLLFTLLSLTSVAQPPEPPSGHGNGTDEQPGGGAPVGNGLFVLLIAGAAYGARKVYEMRKEELEA